MLLQPIYDIAELCAQHGISNAVLCPGSRCAPLILAFAQHPEIKTKTFSDERSACFVALGIAQQIQKPVPVVCTSGSAAYNFAPAIAEAYYQQVPLIILTADRPSEWIDQWDGQTIRQQNLYGQHVKKSFSLPDSYDHKDSFWHIHRIVNEAILLAQEFPKGPVHINIPLREPLYPAKDERINFNKKLKVVTQSTSNNILSDSEIKELKKSLTKFTKVIVVGGQHEPHEIPAKNLPQFCKSNHAVLIGDIISNLHSLHDNVRFADSFLGQCGDSVKESLAPELVITFGKSVISKNLKLFLRKHKPSEHWHIQPQGFVADPFQTLTRIIHCSPNVFFESLQLTDKQDSFHQQKKENYVRIWQAEESRTIRSARKYFSQSSFSEFQALREIISALPARCNLHLANSMSVRYANFIGLTTKQKGIQVFANRGTSGIDGCTSTAVGHALSSTVPNILITGDMAFFYDRNAFWHNYPLPNLHIVLVNNQGGVIFNLIDGPGNLKEKDEYFVTKQSLQAAHLAAEFGFTYLRLDSSKKTAEHLKNFFDFDGKTKILEISGDQEIAKQSFEQFKDTIKKGYEA